MGRRGGARKIFAEYKIRDAKHFRQVKATVDRFIQSPQAQAKYGDVNDIMHVKMKATQDYMMKGMQAQMGAGGKLAGEVEPVEGVSLELWAEQMVRVASGATIDDVCKTVGCDKAKWDRVSAEWNARMSRDTTATIAMAYGNAFTKAQAKPGVGGSKYAQAAQTPGKGEPPISLERYVEVMEAQSCAHRARSGCAGRAQEARHDRPRLVERRRVVLGVHQRERHAQQQRHLERLQPLQREIQGEVRDGEVRRRHLVLMISGHPGLKSGAGEELMDHPSQSPPVGGLATLRSA